MSSDSAEILTVLARIEARVAHIEDWVKVQEVRLAVNAIDPVEPTPLMNAVAAGEEWAVARWGKFKAVQAKEQLGIEEDS